MQRVVAVLACHGRRAATLSCLAALFACRAPNLIVEAVLVDDASPDGTPEAVAERFPQVGVIRGSGSLWWAGAMRAGTDLAARSAPAFILWLNDDVVLDPDALARLVAVAEGHPDAIVVGAVRDPATGARTYGGQVRTRWHPFRFTAVEVQGTVVACDTFQGNVVLIPGAVLGKIGSIDPAFDGVQGMADTDLGLRAGAAGCAVLQAPGTVGTCALNDAPPAWRDGRVGFPARIRSIFGPRGYPLRAWSIFARRHGGPIWPIYLAAMYGLAMIRALRPLPGRGPWRVAFCEGLVPDYRVPFLDRLGADPALSLTVFAGQARSGVSVANARALPPGTREGRNIFWPRADPRLLWSAGSSSIIAERFDAVFASFHAHELSVWLMLLSRLILGRPRMVLSGHFRADGEDGNLVSILRRVGRRLLARGADAVLPYTAAGARNCESWGVARDRIFLLGNSLDVSAIRAVQSGADEVEQLRFRLGIAKDATVFLFVGRWIAARRLDVAIDALALVRAGGRDVHLVLVGNGPEAPRLRAMSEGQPGVHLLPGTSDEAVLAPIFETASAVVIPDAAGLLVVHAFARRRPIITCRDGVGHGPEVEYAVHGVNALLVEPFGASALAAGMVRLADDPGLSERLGDGAGRMADRLGIDRMVEESVAALRRAMR